MKIVLSFAALAMGAVVAATPALAQGRNSNDGGPLPEPSAGAPATVSKPNGKPQQTATYYGRNANDGGTVPEPNSAPIASTPNSQAAPAAAHLGRGLNDGGM